jgi:hypothetical protein
MQKNINIVAALQIGLSIFNLLIALIIFCVLKLVGGFFDNAQGSMALSLISNIIVAVFLLISIPGILAGLGLYKRKEWARIVTIILSIFELFSFPVGTAIAIFSIWAMIQPETIALFSETDSAKGN